MPRSAVEKVIELTVSEANLTRAIDEAEKLPSVEITKLDCQWLQVHMTCTEHVCNFLKLIIPGPW